MIKNLRIRLTAIFTALTGLILAVVIILNGWFAVTQLIKENKRYMIAAADQMISTLQNAIWNAGESNNIEIEYSSELPYFIVINKNGKQIATMGSLNENVNKDALLKEASSLDLSNSNLKQGYLGSQSKTSGETGGTEEYKSEEITVSVDAPINSLAKTKGTVRIDSKEFADESGGESETQNDYPSDAYIMAPVIISPYGSDSELEAIHNFSLDGRSFRAIHIPVYFEKPTSDGNVTLVNADEFEIFVIEDLAKQNQRLQIMILGYILLFVVGLGLLTLANWIFAKLIIKPTEESIRRQADFVAAASHELRSPLAVIRSSLSAADSCSDPKEALKYRSAAESEADRMARLIDDLLLLAGGDAGSWKIQNSSVDLDTVLIEANEQFLPLIRQKNLELELELPDETLPQINGDKLRIRQILSVLVDNAMQYAPEQSTITIAARQAKNKVQIDVIDHGSGISEENRTRVFDRFYRADKSRSDKNHFGLGLSVAKELTELHDGTLTVHETPGGGATFRLSLPLPSKI